MQLTKHTDFALRTLLFLAARGDEITTADEIGMVFAINRHHLGKVVHRLVQLGYVEAKRGRGGGLVLAKQPQLISLAGVVNDFEPNFELLECFNPATSTCPATPSCMLKGVLNKANKAFMHVLMDYSLADVMGQPGALMKVLNRTS